MAGIRLEDVDFDRETIKVMGKGAKERVVRIGKTAQKALLRYLLMRRDDHPCLWVSEEQTPLTHWGIADKLNSAQSLEARDRMYLSRFRQRETPEEKIGVLPTVQYGGLEGTIARTETGSCLELSGVAAW